MGKGMYPRHPHQGHDQAFTPAEFATEQHSQGTEPSHRQTWRKDMDLSALYSFTEFDIGASVLCSISHMHVAKASKLFPVALRQPCY